MSETSKGNKKNAQKKRIESAKKNLEEMQRKIKPFVKQRKGVVQRSTAGQWSDGKSLTRQDVLSVSRKVYSPFPLRGIEETTGK
jgi:hypothetical protein